MMRKKETIDDLIFDHVEQRSIKMQLSVELSIIKHISDEEEEPDKILLYLNTDMVRVDYIGPERRQFVEVIEHMLNTINCFASYGGGWLEEKISKVDINFAKKSPMSAGSYLPLRNDLKKKNYNLINIETKTTSNVFSTALLHHTL